jgi:hypothetical protein
MADKILFIFEGAKTEKHIFENLPEIFNKKLMNGSIFTAHCTVIYKLWKDLSEDEYLSPFELIKNLNDKNKIALKGLIKDDISQIFLFFDYDGHDPTANDDTLIDILEFFNEETDNGKLYINYPMVESIKDINQNEIFKDKVVPAKINIHYKNLVSETSDYIHFNLLTDKCWQFLFKEQFSKANFITTGNYSLYSDRIEQKIIFRKQLEKYIIPNEQVAVLSSIPLYWIDYLGLEFMNTWFDS